MENNDLLHAISLRYATKKFNPDAKIAPDLWKTLEETLILTPSSFGLQPWQFIVITNPEVRKELRQHSWDQSQITDASHLVVFAARRDLVEADIQKLVHKICEVRGLTPQDIAPLSAMMHGFVSQKSPQERFDWNKRQCYIALGQFMASAIFAGVDTCPIEGFSPPDYDRILGLEHSPYAAIVACAAGYHHPEDKYAKYPKVRYSSDQLIHHIG